MTISKEDPIQRFMTSMKLRKKYEDFERNTTIAFHTILGIINKTERLRALARLRKEATKEIGEIAKLEDFREQDIILDLRNLAEGNIKKDNWSDHEGKAVGEPSDVEEARETRKKIHKLWEHIIIIDDEIGKLRTLIEAQRPSEHKTIQRQFIEQFKDPGKAIDTVQLLKERGAIDKNDKWIGISSPAKKGELKLVWNVLHTFELLKKDLKETTSARIFYERFQHEENYNERTLRDNIKDNDLRQQYEKLFKKLHVN